MKKNMKRWLALALSTVVFANSTGFQNIVPVRAEQPEEEKQSVLKQTSEGIAELRKTSFNYDWRFYLEDGESINASGKDFDDSAWRQLNLPHDYSIELDFDKNSPAGANGGYLNGGVGWYRKTFVLPEYMNGKKISIDFGGIYMDSTTYVNGTLVGNYPYGYTPFAYDITDKVVADGVTENVIAIKVNHQQPSSRWYSGSGIYRNVDLVVTDPVHVKRYGTYVTTPDLETEYENDQAKVSVETEVSNDGGEAVEAVVKTTIYDAKGNVFQETQESASQSIAAGEEVSYEQLITTQKPELWSVDNPNLYKMVTEVVVENEVVDVYDSNFGFRWVEMDANEGFFLNNEYMKLNGVCMHHDQGALGAVANYRAIERQMQTMKSMGVNAIRVTHNPAADELLEICNRLGLMVIDEAFDCWESGKRAKDYGRFFNKAATHPDAKDGMTWAEFDIKQMVERGKNEPCIIMWSIGNEIVGATKETAQKLVNWVGEVDPTRPATQGFNNFIDGFWDSSMKQVANVTGVVGFNYGEKSYDAAHKEYPDWIMMGSETSSAVRSRGFYKVDDQKKIRSNYDDGNTVGWGLAAEAAWKANRDRKFIMGEFMWTGFDYIGEPSPYHNQFPAKSSYFGAVDTAGIPKDAYYIYQSQWTNVEDNPMVHLLPHWNWENDTSITKDGKIAVQAYSNAASVELYLNGRSLGKKDFAQKKTTDGRPYQEGENGHIYLEWLVEYAPGELKAVARDENGDEIATDIIQTAGKPAKVRLTPDRKVIKADGQDLSYMLVEILDENNNVVPTANNMVNFQISGNGTIVGVDNGDATEVEDSYKGDKRKAYSGKAMVIVQSTQDAGSFTLTAKSSGLLSEKVSVFTKEPDENGEILLGYEVQKDIATKLNTMPTLPATVTAVYSSERREEMPVVWNKIDPEQLKKAGVFKVEGVIEGTTESVSINIIVMDYIGIKDISIVTGVGNIPTLPDVVQAVYNTGEEEEVDVTWEAISQEQVAQMGTFTVEGTVAEYGVKAKAIVRVTESEYTYTTDIAKRDGTYPIPKASFEQSNGNDPVTCINNGIVVYEKGAAGERWIPWGHGVEDEWIQLELEESHVIGKVGIDFWNNPSDTAMANPDKITISYSEDGETWKDVENQDISEKEQLKSHEENIISFDPVTAKYIRWNMYSQAKLAPGISEVHVYEQEEQFVVGNTAMLEDLKVDGTTIDGFAADLYNYSIELEYGAAVPEVTAVTSDGATVFVIPALSNEGTTMIQVTSEDGKTVKTYNIQFHTKAPKLEEVQIELSANDVTEDDILDISLAAKLQDQTILSSGVIKVNYMVGNSEIAKVENGKFYAYAPGTTTLQASVTYQGVTVESNLLTIVIKKNLENKVITGYEQIIVSTEIGKIPTLPEKIKATFDIGLPKMVNITWDAIKEEQVATYGEFVIEGSVEGQALRAKAKVVVKGIMGIQQFSTATALGVVPKLPEKASLYYSDGTKDDYTVKWEAHPQELFTKDGEIVTIKGIVEHGEDADLKTECKVRVSSKTKKGDKFTGYKNGFYWPLGIASFTNGQGSSGDSASELNDNIISHESTDNNRWCNWTGTAREEDWAGIIFGLEEVTNKFIDNLEVDFYLDYGSALPDSYEIQYYDGEYFNEPPVDPDNVTADHLTGVDTNWKSVKNLKAPATLSGTDTNYFTFDTVETCAIRIKMKAAPEKCLAITEMGAYEKIVDKSKNTNVLNILVNGIALPDFDSNVSEYVYKVTGDALPEITADVLGNESVTVIQATGFGQEAKVIVTAENGVDTKTYKILLENEQPKEKSIAVYKNNKLLAEITETMLQEIMSQEGNKSYAYSNYDQNAVWEESKEVQGPTIQGVLEKAGISIADLANNAVIRFEAAGHKQAFTKEQLFATRYFYPMGNKGTENGNSGNMETEKNKVKVPAVLDIKQSNGDLYFGQTAPNEQNKVGFIQGAAVDGKIIIEDKAQQWDSVIDATLEDGITTIVGSTIDFKLPGNMEDAKVIYTINDQKPIIYNYKKDKVNTIKLDKNGKYSIKVMVVGYGKQDSKVKTFNYEVVTKNGWLFEHGVWYFYKNNQKVTNWLHVGNKWYYLDAKKDGAMKIGWYKEQNKWYYLSKNGAMETGWVKVDNKWYYMSKSGAMETGWTKVDNKWYYLNENGSMKTGWYLDGNKWYYLKSNGVMATGWAKVDNKWFYLKSNGVMARGWVKDSNKWYFMKENGAMATGWTFDGKKTYYLNTVTGAWNGNVK